MHASVRLIGLVAALGIAACEYRPLEPLGDGGNGVGDVGTVSSDHLVFSLSDKLNVP